MIIKLLLKKGLGLSLLTIKQDSHFPSSRALQVATIQKCYPRYFFYYMRLLLKSTTHTT